MPKSLNKYRMGYCAEFAVALHRLYGWPLGVFYDTDKEDGEQYTTLAHAFVVHPSGALVDSDGLRSKALVKGQAEAGLRMAEGLGASKGHFITEATATEASLEQESMEGVNAALVRQAMAWIRKHPDRYGGSLQAKAKNWYATALRAEAMRRSGVAHFEHPDRPPVDLPVSWDHPYTAPRPEAWKALKRRLQLSNPRLTEHPAALGWRLVDVAFNAAVV